ncbi:MAG TPA: type II secretion system F family protein [archaeon]|nr:type II secretion system F family protein [archaeon]
MKENERLKLGTTKIILISTGVTSLVLIMAALVIGSLPLLVNMILLSMLLLVVPYSAYKFIRLKRIKSYEDELPNFLRDMSESVRADLSLIQAIHAGARSDYGMLTQEVQKMSNQLSWNVPLEKVLRNFAERVSDSKTVVRSIMIIEQSGKSGGNIEDTLEALASNIESIRETQQEKSVLLNQQVMMMYAIFFIFLGITITLIKFLIPLLQSQRPIGGFGTQTFNPNPCYACINSDNPACSGCNAFGTIAVAFSLGDPNDAASYYKSLFLAMILIQGFFSGLIAGQIGSDSMTVGMKHSMIMLLSGFLVFMIAIKTGLV